MNLTCRRQSLSLFILLFFCVSSFYGFAANKKDSLLFEATFEKNFKRKTDLYNELAQCYQDSVTQMADYALRAYYLAKDNNYEYGLANARLNLAVANFDIQNYDSTLNLLLDAEAFFDRQGIRSKLAVTCNYIGIIYEYKAAYTLSLSYYFKALKINEAQHDSVLICKTLNNIGLSHYIQKNYSTAIEYFNKAFAIVKAQNLKAERLMVMNNLGMVYLSTQQYDRSLDMFKQVLTEDLKTGVRRHIAESYNNIGEAYLKKGDLTHAKENLLKAEELKNTADLESDRVGTFLNLAMLSTGEKKYEQAKIYLEKGLYIARKFDNKNMLISIYDAFVDYFKARGDYLNALQYDEFRDQLYEDLHGQVAMNSYNTLQSQYELDKKKSQQAIQAAVQDKEEYADGFLKIIAAISVISLVVLLVLTWNIYHKNRMLRLKQKDVENKNTILMRQNEQVMKAQRIANQALKVKSQFISTISHEVRTPLNAINGVVELLMKDNPRQEQIENLNLMKVSSDSLLRLINDILDFSKMESGQNEFAYTSFSLIKLINNIDEIYKLKAAEKDLEFFVEYDKKIPSRLKGDPVRLNQVLSNLLSNAMKFTEQGYIKLTVKQVDSSSMKSRIFFEVRDTGIGIPKEKQQEIFEIFTQAESSNTRKYGGAGLGLSISQKIIEGMNARLNVNSIEGTGSIFSFEINLDLDEETSDIIKKINASPDTFTLEGKHILIVEDNVMNVMVIKQFLNGWKCTYDIAINGKQGLEMAEAKLYDAVLMDIQMPEMDGIEATKRIRALSGESYRKLPILAITAANEVTLRDAAYDAGMNDYILKPFKPDELKEKMLRAIYGNETKAIA